MSDEPDPPRKFYGFKPREFERVNAPAPQAQPSASPAKTAGAPSPAGPLTVQDLLHHANSPQHGPGAGPPAPSKNDVQVILRDNLARANAAGMHHVNPLPPRPSRRRRDYVTLLVFGNTIFGIGMLVGHDNPMVFVYSLSGAALFNVGVTWIIWVLMDRY